MLKLCCGCEEWYYFFKLGLHVGQANSFHLLSSVLYDEDVIFYVYTILTNDERIEINDRSILSFHSLSPLNNIKLI